MADLVDAMVQETHLRLSSDPRWKDQTFTTLYLGGGTPSILPPDLLEALVSGVLRQWVKTRRISAKSPWRPTRRT